MDDTLLIASEIATVAKKDTVTGLVRVSTRTELSEELVAAVLDRSDVEVTRVSIGRDIESAPPIRTEGDVTIIPVVEEILVVEKRLVLREEIHVRQVTTSQSVELPVALRKQRAVIERDEIKQSPNDKDT